MMHKIPILTKEEEQRIAPARKIIFASAATHLAMKLPIFLSGSCPVHSNPAKPFFIFIH